MPSDADIEAAKKTAASRGTTAELLPFPDIEAAVIALAFTPADFARYADTRSRNQDDAIGEAYANQVVWPPADEADALAERIPAFQDLVVAQLNNLAGSTSAEPDVCKLDANTPAGVLTRARLSREKAAELLATYKNPGQLKIARFVYDVSKEGAGFSIVVKVPSRAVYNARVGAYDSAKAAHSGIFDAATQAARDFIVWTSEGDNPDPIFAALPAVVTADLYPLFQVMGGVTAKCERRRL